MNPTIMKGLYVLKTNLVSSWWIWWIYICIWYSSKIIHAMRKFGGPRFERTLCNLLQATSLESCHRLLPSLHLVKVYSAINSYLSNTVSDTQVILLFIWSVQFDLRRKPAGSYNKDKVSGLPVDRTHQWWNGIELRLGRKPSLQRLVAFPPCLGQFVPLTVTVNPTGWVQAAYSAHKASTYKWQHIKLRIVRSFRNGLICHLAWDRPENWRFQWTTSQNSELTHRRVDRTRSVCIYGDTILA